MLSDIDNLMLVDLINKSVYLRELTLTNLEYLINRVGVKIESTEYCTDVFSLMRSLSNIRNNNYPGILRYNLLSEINVLVIVVDSL